MARNSMYGVVNTKIAAMSRGMLQVEDYKKAVSMKSPSEIAVFLKGNTSYSQRFEGYNAEILHRGTIESILKEGLIDAVGKLINYFDGSYRNFFKCFYIKYEIYDLKTIARLIHVERDFSHVRDNLVFTGRYRYMDIERVIRARSVAELINALENTVYHPFVKNLIDGNTGESLFRFEMALDKAYFSILEENVMKLDRVDREAFYNLYGSYIDMLNIQWIYRGKKYYNLTPEEIFNYSINRGCKFNYKKIKELCYCDNALELSRKIQHTPYGFMLKGDKHQDIFMERRMNRFMYFKLKRAQKSFKNDISAVLAYLELLEFEIRDVISLIENVRYGLELEEAKKYLIKAI